MSRTLKLVHDAVQTQKTDDAAALELMIGVLGSLPMGVAQFDSEDRLVAYNRKFLVGQEALEPAVRIGMPKAELIGMRQLGSARTMNKDGQPVTPDQIPKLSTNGQLRLEEVTADGRTIQIDRIQKADGGTAYFRIDITEQKRAESMLRETNHALEVRVAQQTDNLELSEARFRAAFEKSSIGMSICGLDGIIRHVNPAYANLVGYSPADIIGRSVDELSHPSDRAGNRHNRECFASGEAKTGFREKRFIHKNGHIVWVRLHDAVVDGPDGIPLHTVTQVEDITKEKAAEDALKESEERFRGLFESSTVGISMIAPDHHYIIVNDAYCEMHGYSREELAERKFIDLVHPDDRRVILDSWAEMRINDRENDTYVRRHVKKDGTIGWGLVNVFTRRDEDGRHLYNIAQIQDITERHNAELARQESENKFRRLFENSKIAMATSDLNGKITMVNRALSAFVGYSEDELVGEDLGIWAHPEELSRFLKIRELIRNGEVENASMERRFMHKDGGVLWGRANIVVHKDNDGNPDFVINEIQDITDTKIAEQALATSEERHRTLIEGMTEGVAILDADRTVTYVNEAYAQLTGYSADELVGTYGPAINHAETLGETERRLGERRHGESSRYEMKIRRKDGEVVLASVVPQPMFDESGNYSGSFGIFTDITAQRKAEETLIEAKERAEATNQAKSRFLASASHDLRQPLQAINFFMSALVHREVDADKLALLDKTQTSLDALSGILNALLDISRLDAGVIEPQLTDIAVEDLLDPLVDEFRLVAEDRGIELKFVSSQSWVRSDKALLESVFRNLLANAIKYTPAGKVLIGCRRTDTGMRFEVWDTGIGIPAEHLKTIFDEFYQVGNQARDRTQGLGLGLSIVERTAALLGHELGVRSEFGKGSVFSVTVPLGMELMLVDAARAAPESHEAPPRAGSVILIDDEPAILESMELLLESLGYDVHACVCSGPDCPELEALPAACTAPPDIIISDYRLPARLSGIDVITALRRAFGAQVPAILLTGEIGDDVIREATNGNLKILHKPVPIEELCKTMATMMDVPAVIEPHSPKVLVIITAVRLTERCWL